MVHIWDLAMVEKEMACASLRVGSMRNQGSMRDCPPSWPPLLALIRGGEVSGSGPSWLQVYANPN
jgi:hypothetical protein